MQSSQPSVIARDHTLFGVCEALGEDFGFNPILLRIPFAVMLLWNPTVVVCTYVALGVIVLLTRLVAPNPRRAAAEQVAADRQPAASNDEARADLAVAA